MMKRYMAGTLLCLAALLAGCNGGGSNNGGGGGSGNEITVSVNPPGVITQLNQTVQFTAGVSNAPSLNIASSNGAVRDANVVTITTTTAHGFVVGQAVSIQGVADVSFTGTFIITTVPNNTSFKYNQVGTNATSGGGTIPNTAVTWQVNNTTGGNAMVGTISPTGLYTAPSVLVPAVTATITPQGAVRMANTVTITTTAAHTFTMGQIVSITNVAAVNPLTATITANGAVRANNSVTITTTAAHNFTPGQLVTLTGVTDASFNGAFLILSTPSTTTFTFSQTASDANSGGGTASVQVTTFNGTFLIASVPTTTTFTYAQNGANATSGGGTASSAAVQVKAISVADTTKEGTASVVLDSGITLTLSPAAATVATGEQLQFTVTNTGPTSTAFNWFVNDVAGGDATNGMITSMTPAGTTSVATYTAPAAVPAPASVTIKAQAAADAAKSVTASVTISSPGAGPTLSVVSPRTVAQGSAFIDFYLSGANFLTTTEVRFNNVVVNPANVIAVTSTLLRARIPASFFDLTGTFPVTLTSQGGALPAAPVPINVDVMPQRPALISTTPDSVQQGTPTLTAQYTGGYFSTATTAEFNSGTRAVTPGTSTQFGVTLSGADLGTPGLFSVGVRNAAAAQPLAARNVAVQPTALPSLVTSVCTQGGPPPCSPAQPSAVAIEPALGMAVVANRGSGDITRIDLATNSVVGAPITVGGATSSAPTGVATNFLNGTAITANSGTNNISIVNLGTAAVTNLTSLTGPAGVLKPVAVAMNPVSGMALVVNQSTNLATLVDAANGLVVAAVPGVNVGANPEVAVDTRLNWAIVTPGGLGTVSIVDLARGRSFAMTSAARLANVVTVTTPAPHGLLVGDTVTLQGASDATFNGVFPVTAVPSTTTFTFSQAVTDGSSMGGTVGHHPGALATVAVGVNVRGVSVNSETHTAFMVDPTSASSLIFSLLDQTVMSPQTGSGYSSSAVNPLTNIGIQANFGTNQIQAVDLRAPAVLTGSLLMVGTGPRAVAIDPGSNVAVVANETSNDVTIVNLGQLRGGTGPHIVQSSPLVTMTSGVDITLNIAGSNLSGGTVRLDGVALATTVVNSRFLTATVPAAMLSGVRRYNVDVQTVNGVSNVSELSVMQAVTVGTSPAAVAVDSEHNVALVTNAADDTVSVINLSTGAVAGSAITVGDNPQGVAVIPRLGRAVVTNLDSDNATLVPYFDLMTNTITTTATTTNVTTGNGPLGVAINPNDAQAVVANSLANTVSFFSAATGAAAISSTVEMRPTGVVIDPARNLAVVTHTTSNSVVLLNLPGGNIASRATVAPLPEGAVYDPDSDRFVVASALSNNLTLVNPNGAATQIVRVGINPTSIAYNRHSSTLVTVNSASNTMSVMDLKNLRVREVLSVMGSSRFSVAINEQTNVAVVVDQANNRVLLIQLPR